MNTKTSRITLSTTAVCKLCVVEYFCEAKPHERDLQTVQPRSGVLLRLVTFSTQRFLEKNTVFKENKVPQRNINEKTVSPTDAKNILKDAPPESALINTLKDINIAIKLIIMLIVKDNFRFIMALHVVYLETCNAAINGGF